MDTNTARHFTKGQTAYTIGISYAQELPKVHVSITAIVIDSMGAKQGTAHRMENGKMLRQQIYANNRMFANINEAIEVGTTEGFAHAEAYYRRMVDLKKGWLANYRTKARPEIVAAAEASLSVFEAATPSIEISYR